MISIFLFVHGPSMCHIMSSYLMRSIFHAWAYNYTTTWAYVQEDTKKRESRTISLL